MRSIIRETLYDRLHSTLDNEHFEASDAVAAIGAVVEAFRRRHRLTNEELSLALAAVLTIEPGDDLRGAVTTDALILLSREEQEDAQDHSAGSCHA